MVKISKKGPKIYGVFKEFFLKKNIFLGRKMLCGGKCYKMIEKNRGNEVILEMVEALKNKNFEFPRADYLSWG